VVKNIKHQTTPAFVLNLKSIITIAAGENHVFALNSSGTVHAWVVDEQHQLGICSYRRSKILSNEKHTLLTPSPAFLLGSKIDSITCGAYHSFALDDKNNVYAWGLNNFGQTRILTGAVVELPTHVDSLAFIRGST
jgi:regulator of chromosome condensation